MKRPLVVVVGSLCTVLALALLVTLVLSYNGLVAREEQVELAWAQLESNYQRRHNLVPQLVDSVNRHLRHERETLADVTAQRAQAMERLGRVADELAETQEGAARRLKDRGELPGTPAATRTLAESESRLTTRTRRLLAVVENYPRLRSSDQFLRLQAQLEGTANRINVARMRFNRAVDAHNQGIRRLPGRILAAFGGFERKAYFEADEGAADADQLDFD